MTALDRAVALAEVDDVAVRVGEHLHLDVAGIFEVALDVDRRVGEVLLALAARGVEGSLRLGRVGDDLHPLAAAPRRGLDEQRVPDLLPEAYDLGCRGDGIGGARDDRNAGLLHPRAR